MEPSAKRRALRLSTIQLQELSEAIGPEKTQKEPSPRVDLKVAPVTRKRKTTVSTPSINIARTQSSKLLNKHWTESQVQELKKKTNSSADHKPLPNYPLCMSHNTLFTPTIENSPSNVDSYMKNIYNFVRTIKDDSTRYTLVLALHPNYSREELMVIEEATKFTGVELTVEETAEQRKYREWKEFIHKHEDSIVSTLWTNAKTASIKGGTMRDLVYSITGKRMFGSSALTALLITYRSYASPNELLDLLIERFQVSEPANSPKDPEFIEFFHTYLEQPVQIQVGKVLKKWVDTYWYDFENNANLKEKAIAWINNTLVHSEYDYMASSIHQNILKKSEGTHAHKIHYLESPPAIIKPKSNNWKDFAPLEIARQMCLQEFKLFSKILPKECIHQSWTKKNKEELSPHICALIQKSNSISKGIASLILSEPKIKGRVKIIKNCIKIAIQCNELNNFNGFMEISAGLQLAPIYRLKKTWELVPKKLVEAMDELRAMVTPGENWKLYRNEIKKRNPPCIPYLGMYLTDLTFIEDGHPDFLPERADAINFIKYQQLSVVIQDLQQYQQKMYYFEEVPVIQNFLDNLVPVSEEEMYKISLELEPRGSK